MLGSINIKLPARLEDELRWQGARSTALEARESGKTLFWEFDFGMGDSPISLDDSGHFLSFATAIDHFMKTLGTEFAHSTAGVILYRGDLNFHERLIWSGDLKDYFEEWVGTLPEGLVAPEQLFCVNLFAEYMHRLASYLSEMFIPYCFFDTSSFASKAAVSQLLSKERFGFIVVKEPSSGAQGIVLPSDAQCDKNVLNALDRLFAEFESQKIAYKIIPEALLSEEWEGLDVITAIADSLSHPGRRMLQGFSASGGQVIFVEKK